MGFHATCQAVGHLRQSQDVGRASQQKAAGTTVLVDGHLERQHQLGRSLNFVEDGPVQRVDKAYRVALRRRQRGWIVQRVVAHFPGQLSNQRGLATLARAIDQDRWRVLQRCSDRPGNVPFNQAHKCVQSGKLYRPLWIMKSSNLDYRIVQSDKCNFQSTFSPLKPHCARPIPPPSAWPPTAPATWCRGAES